MLVSCVFNPDMWKRHKNFLIPVGVLRVIAVRLEKAHVTVRAVQAVKTLGKLHSVINIDLLNSISSTIIPVCIQNNVSQHTGGCFSEYQ